MFPELITEQRNSTKDFQERFIIYFSIIRSLYCFCVAEGVQVAVYVYNLHLCVRVLCTVYVYKVREEELVWVSLLYLVWR